MADLYSPGRIITLWRAIHFVNSQGGGGIEIRDVVAIFEGTALGGGTLIKESMRIAVTNGMVTYEGGRVFLSEIAINQLIPLCKSEEPNVAVTRAILFLIIRAEKFHWLAYFDHDPGLFKTGIPNHWVELLEAAALFDFEATEVIQWWVELLEEFNRFEVENLKEIGDLGEKLTFEFEKERLTQEKIKNGPLRVTWVSQISNSMGFDIRSVKGKLLKGRKLDPAFIEVKSSGAGDKSQFRFNISRNEWETALKHLEIYFFYCWVGVDLAHGVADEGPFIVPAGDLVDSMPMDRNPMARWSESRLTIDLSSYLFSK
jgi:hypothetical protein